MSTWRRLCSVASVLILLCSYSNAEFIVGIDLGTTYSCVGIFRAGQVEIIPNEQGNRITPSMVSFTDEERLIGDAAKNQASMNPERTIYDAKRMIGRKFNDPILQGDIKTWPFKVINKGSKPVVQVEVQGETKIFFPEEVSGMVLRKMKEVAEIYLGEEISKAVVTVPAYFNDAQRQATKDAGVIAGLEVLRIINEPTAAAIAFGLGKNLEGRKVLVFDLGGGTFDVSLVTIDDGIFEVLATNGDTHLGGQDFDHRVLEYFSDVVEKKTKRSIRKEPRALGKLKREIEKAKRTLSSQTSVRIQIENLLEGFDFEEILTRAKFEELNIDLFRKTLIPVKRVLEDSANLKNEIDEIVLVGGSTRIPRVVALLEEFFGGKKANKQINPDEAVAYGAAVQAGILAGEEETKDVLLIDVCALSLGIEVSGNAMSKIVERNHPIPTKKTQGFTTTTDNQFAVNIRVFEGERAKVSDNNLLGEFTLGGIAPAPRGVPQIEVTFEINRDGILTVTAVDLQNGNKNSIQIKNDKGRLSQKEIQRMLEEAERHSKEDKEFRERQEAKQKLENSVYGIKSQLKTKQGLGKLLSFEEKEEVGQAVQDALFWMEGNTEASTEEFKDKLTEFLEALEPIISKQTGAGHDHESDHATEF